MFEATCGNLLEQIETIIQAAKMGESLRKHVTTLPTKERPLTQFDAEIENLSPALLAWHVYDHCASVTRLYSVFEVFLSAYIRDVCEALPTAVSPYSSLPIRLRKAHRVGFGKIILEIEEKQYHRALKQEDLLATYTHALTDKTPYRLIVDAFLVTKRALRFQQILGLLADVGFEEVEQRILGHQLMARYLPGATTAETRKLVIQSKLDELIDVRNEAAHTDVSQTWGVETLRDTAYFLRDFSLALADLGERVFLQRHLDSRLLVELGQVTEVYSSGHIVVAILSRSNFKVRDEVILGRKGAALMGSIVSLQTDGTPKEEVITDSSIALGMQITLRAQVGDIVFVRPETLAVSAVELPDTDVEPIEDEIREEQTDTDEVIDDDGADAQVSEKSDE